MRVSWLILLSAGCQFSVRALGPGEGPDLAVVEMGAGPVDDLAQSLDLLLLEPDLAMPDLLQPDLLQPDMVMIPIGPSSDVAEDVLAYSNGFGDERALVMVRLVNGQWKYEP